MFNLEAQLRDDSNHKKQVLRISREDDNDEVEDRMQWKLSLGISLSMCLILVMVKPSVAWSPLGHQVVAQIAYNHLSPHTRERVLKRVETWNQHPATVQDFDRAAAWADFIKGAKVRAFNPWHYIDHPWVVKGSRMPANARRKSRNAVWAVQQSLAVLRVEHSDPMLQAFFFRMLIHIVADLHQPMHCISRYSEQTPKGDLGGNRYPINVAGTRNLHAYWDRGLGVLPKPTANGIALKTVQSLAEEMGERYPPEFFGKEKIENENALQWSWDSYKLARANAYRVAMHKAPSKAYQARGRRIAREQLALAGYRLAYLLENLYGD